MQIKERFTVAAPRDAVWKFFEDIGRVARCVPGVQSVDVLSPDRYKVVATQKVGFISATFEMTTQIEQREAGKLLALSSVGKSIKGAVGSLRSRDRVSWTFVSYALDRLDLGPSFRLEEGRNEYGRGIWAPCFRFHDGTYYIFSNVNGQTTQLIRATSPAGPWTRTPMKRSLHDLSVLFDDDGLPDRPALDPEDPRPPRPQHAAPG